MSGELSLRVAVEGYGSDSQSPEEQRGGVVGCTVGTVEDHGKIRLADGVDIELGDDGIHILIGSTEIFARMAGLLPVHRCDILIVLVLDGLFQLRGCFGTVIGDNLDTVELRGIVGCGNHHTTDDSVGPYIILECGGGKRSQIDDVAADGHESSGYCHLEHIAGVTGIGSDGGDTGVHCPDGFSHLQSELNVHVLVNYTADTVRSEHLGHLNLLLTWSGQEYGDSYRSVKDIVSDSGIGRMYGIRSAHHVTERSAQENGEGLRTALSGRWPVPRSIS